MTTVRMARGSREGVGKWRLGCGVTPLASLDGEEVETLVPLSARLVRCPFYAQLAPIKSETIRRNGIECWFGVLGDGKRHVADTFGRARFMFENHKGRTHWGDVGEKGL